MKIASYNVLADGYIRPAYYPRVRPEWLDPAHRLPALVRRIAGLAADIICLQEVEKKLMDALVPVLAGYAWHYLPRGGRRPDGCAIFVRHGEPQWSSIRLGEHVALAMKLGALTVVTAHIQWDAPGCPPSQRTGLAQIERLLGLLDGPSILCGDFNCTPDDEALRLCSMAGLRDPYENIHPNLTCVTNGRAKRIDYLLHTQSLGLKAIPLGAIGDDTVLPSPDEPSDHLPLTAEIVTNVPV